MTILGTKGRWFGIEFEQGNELADDLLVYVNNCGTFSESQGAPLLVRANLLTGITTVYIWADINQEDPTHEISLEGAMEDDSPAFHADESKT